MTISYSTYYKQSKNFKNNKYDKEFIQWIDVVESIVYSKLNFKLLEFSDEAYYCYFEDHLKPEDVANKIIENNIF